MELVSTGTSWLARMLAVHTFRRVRRRLRGSPERQLERRLRRRFEGHEFLGAVDFKFLRKSPVVVSEVGLLLRGQPFNEQALIDALAPLVAAPSDAAPPLDQLARDVLDAIKEEAWATHDGVQGQIMESRRLHHEQEKLIASLGAQAPQVVIATFDWSPQELHEHLKELATTDPAEYANLQNELAPAKAQPERVAKLIDRPPQWLKSGSGPLWLVVGRLAAAQGQFSEAERAFKAAEERPLSDRAVAIALRGEVAAAVGQLDQADALAKEAHLLDPTNAAASILRARFETDAAQKLRLLDDARPKTGVARAAIEATRALVLLQQRRIADAVFAAKSALAETPDSWYVQEITALTTLYREQDRDARGEGADWAALKEAADRFLELRRHMVERGRTHEALGFLARAAQAHAAAHDTHQAKALLAEAARDSVLAEAEEDTRVELAAGAIALGEWELADALLPTSESAPVRVLRATIGINTGIPALALATLDEVIADETINSPARAEAALTRAHAAANGVGEWSAKAEEVIRAINDTTANVLRARYLERHGDRETAEQLLVADGSPAAQDFLVAMAVDAEDYPRALARMEAVVREAPTPFRRVHLAGMLLATDRTRALVMLAQLRADPDVPHRFRVEAAQIATKDAYDAGRYDEAITVAREWLVLDPSNRTAAWVLIDALQKVGDATAALAAEDEFGPEASNDWEVSVAVRLYSENLDAASALERLAQLSARADDPNPKIGEWIARLAR